MAGLVMILKVFFLFLTLGMAPQAGALDLDLTRGAFPVVDGWTFSPGLEGDQWVPVRPGESLQLGEKGGWFRLRMTLEKVRKTEQPAYLFMGKYYAPAEIYLNGVLIHTRGRFPPRYFVQIAQPLVVRLPESLLKGDGRDQVEVKSYYAGPSMPLSATSFGGNQEYRFETGLSEFFNATIYFVFATINFFAGAFFLVQYFYRRNYLANLLFAFSSIFMALYFYEIGAGDTFLDSQVFRHLAKAGLPLSMTFLLLFYTEYFGIHRTWLFRSVTVVIGVAAGIFLLLAPHETGLNERFKLVLMPLLLSLLFSVYMVLRATFGGNRDAVPIMVGSILGVGFGCYDVIYFIIGAEPFAWFQSIGFFSVQMSMFLSLAIRSARLYKELETYSAQLEDKKVQLTALNASMSRFVPQEFLSFLGKESITEIELGDGVLKEMTVLFTDIRNFTSLSERLSPEENFRLLNSYLSRMAPIIRESGGIIDKYIGDAIMALFPGNPGDALLAALRMRTSFREYNEGRRRAGYETLETGVGLHSGALIMGTIGEEKRMDSTVISDAVNIASRLEALTKVAGVPVLTTSATLARIPAYDKLFAQRYLGNITVRGKTNSMGIHEVLSESSDPLYDLKISQKPAFEEAVKVFESGDFPAAKKLFKELAKVPVPDPVAVRYFQSLEKNVPSLVWSFSVV